ncbi:hypothetical protein WJX79_009778 [Trebouxia sp. C0005]
MTRKPNVRSRVLAARSSFWETLPQECASQLNCRASVSEPDCTTPSLYDQLLQLKDWTEERAELCFASPERQHDVVEGRPSAALLSTIQWKAVQQWTKAHRHTCLLSRQRYKNVKQLFKGCEVLLLKKAQLLPVVFHCYQVL